MESQTLYRKWRPQTLSEVVGQEQVTRTLLNALKSSRVSHAYLFCGPRGTGKTSTGRILAKAVNCLTNAGTGEPCNTCENCQDITTGKLMDVIEIDAASNRGIDDIRDLREKVNYAPGKAKYKVYIIDEVHMLGKEAANALLKTLEEPPPGVIFILATTEGYKLLPTIMSRCQRFDFHRITMRDIAARLSRICQGENITIEPEGLNLIARSAAGSLRDASNLLEQLSTYYGNTISLEQVKYILGITGDARTRELAKSIIESDVTAGIKTINQVTADGLDLRQFNRELVEYLRALLLVKTGAESALDMSAEDIAEMKKLADKAPLTRVLKAVKTFGQLDFTFDSYSPMPLELAMVDCSLAAAPVEAVKPERPAPAAAARVQPVKHEDKAKVEKKSEPAESKAPAVETVKVEPVKMEAAPLPQRIAEPSALNAPPPPPAAPLTPPAPGKEFEELGKNWKQIIDEAPVEVRKSSALSLLKFSAKLMHFENDIVTLNCASVPIKNQMDKPENQKIFKVLFSKYLGRECNILCVYKAKNDYLVREALKNGAQKIIVEEK